LCPRSTGTRVAFSPREDFVATAGEDRVVRVWDAVTHKMVCELVSHTDRIPALAWSPDRSLLVSAGWDTSARVWRPPQADPLILLNSHADQVHTLAFGPDGKFLACADSDFDIYLWSDPTAAKVAHVLRGHNDEIRCLAFSPDGTRLAEGPVDQGQRAELGVVVRIRGNGRGHSGPLFVLGQPGADSTARRSPESRTGFPLGREKAAPQSENPAPHE
jgi:WD40 repeat protein